MNRRGFLALLAPAALVVPALVIARRSFFLPPSGGWPGTGLTADKLRAFKSAMLEQMYREIYPPVVLDGRLRRYEGVNFVTSDEWDRIVPWPLVQGG